MNKHSKITAFLAATVVSASLTSGAALAHDHGDVGVWGDDQSVSEGTVTAKKVMAEENGWLVVHRTDKAMKPGPVVGYAPLKKGKNMDVPAILTEEVASGDMLMLMVHSEDGGMKTGVFEYTLGAKEDGPIRKDGELVMTTVTAK
ncbi:DUF7282 domain-containing protein [Hydrocarboniclastica marina]|uniref:DUF7282 domain-containing protein n=1 Tax=Hydrocarboniclastica marina TaxID=2259620 RepID=A0A4P7XDA4_9ALTE|nr:hypothetical protein [Hydrocarboniclastica marina]QCF24821.1 hypothetical protein soil367_01975 [Hydrocarboniclastica marina]